SETSLGRGQAPKVRDETAALRDFSPVFVRFGSFATEMMGAIQRHMSALPPKADIDLRDAHVRLVPKADIRIAANLFDHLVGACQHGCRHVEPERLRGLEVYH